MIMWWGIKDRAFKNDGTEVGSAGHKSRKVVQYWDVAKVYVSWQHVAGTKTCIK